MGIAADGWQARGRTVPGPFFARLAEIRKQERASIAAEDEIPLAEAYQ
jgi:hypothetical protein